MHVSGIPGRSVPEFVYKLMAAITGHISMVNDSTKCHLYSLQPTIPHSPPYSRHPPLPVLHSPLSLLHSTALISPLPAPHFPLPPKSQTPIYIFHPPLTSYCQLCSFRFLLLNPYSTRPSSQSPLSNLISSLPCKYTVDMYWSWFRIDVDRPKMSVKIKILKNYNMSTIPKICKFGSVHSLALRKHSKICVFKNHRDFKNGNLFRKFQGWKFAF